MFKRMAIQDFRITQFIDRTLEYNVTQLGDTLKSAETIDRMFERIKKKVVRKMEEAYISRKLGQTRKERMNRISKEICKRVIEKA
jgi:hypothetical protein